MYTVEPGSNDLSKRSEAGATGLARGLSGRQIEFIAIGGSIGAGLFLGSGQGIQLGGPSILLAYIFAGSVVYVMCRALGEITLNLAPAPSFIPHIENCVGRWAGFVTGWSYWLMWVFVGIGELTAVAILMKYWFPNFPQWIAVASTLACLLLLNHTSTSLFGELEFWLTLIKVITIVALIAGGFLMIIFHFGPLGHEAGLANLWIHHGFFPNGMGGFCACLVVALFNFGGIELIGVTAGAANDPQRSIPRAIRAVVIRILIFYVGSMTIMMAVAPWDTFSADRSPYVMVFELVGLAGAASIINFVVVTAVISQCNSGFFATGRLLFSLARQGDAPAWLRTLDGRNMPGRATVASAAVMVFGILLNYAAPQKAFSFLLSMIAALLIWTWIMIVLAHLGFRRAQTKEQARANVFPMPLYPLTNWMALATFGLVLVLMAFEPVFRPTFYTAAGWFCAISAIYFLTIGRRTAIRAALLSDQPSLGDGMPKIS